MDTHQLLDLHEKTCEKCREIMKAKNTDYCGGSGDPFANFRISEMLGVHPAIGIMMRMTDKMQRIKSFVKNGTLAVRAESFEDACDDLVNYAILLKGLLIEESGKTKGPLDKHHENPRCGWRGFAGGDGCVLKADHEGPHKFSDGSGGGGL